MAEPLKNAYNKEFIVSLCDAIEGEYAQFDSKKFQRFVFDKSWASKELKGRMRHITEGLHVFLPEDYEKALEILKPVSEGFSGFEAMFFPDFVEVYGLENYRVSVKAMEHFTKYSSSEFAVRPFIVRYPKKMMKQMLAWAGSANHHVRRLASEGCRPRLPWAMALPEFKKDPSAILPVLEKLNNDSSHYVRKSVANNLNDISKDHPRLVTGIVKKWLGKHEHTDWILKHGSRTLLKKGNSRVMKLFGFNRPSDLHVKKFEVQKKVKQGKELCFSFELSTEKKKLGKIRVEYAIDFMRKNGRHSRKVFKVSEINCAENKRVIEKRHSFKKISTRKYYPGSHGLTVIVNGVDQQRKNFDLL